jgi:hypothetical protein
VGRLRATRRGYLPAPVASGKDGSIVVAVIVTWGRVVLGVFLLLALATLAWLTLRIRRRTASCPRCGAHVREGGMKCPVCGVDFTLQPPEVEGVPGSREPPT